MTIDFYSRLAQALERGDAVVATVIATRGSVPREVGAKLFVDRDGAYGTIGGGAGEAKVMRQALAVLATGEKQRVEIDLTGAAQRETEGVCGGIMQVWLERWSSPALAVEIVRRLKSGKSVTLVMPFTEQPAYLLDESLDESISESLGESLGELANFAVADAFVETLRPEPMLLIVGAGHVGIQLAKVADLAGFQVAVQDERPEWANAKHYPQAMLLHQPIEMALESLVTHPQLYVALVTRGYQYDLAALNCLLNCLLKRDTTCRYIGMIGSERRVRQVFQAIQQQGTTAEQLKEIHAPIGLDIGALTPAEIAVSIVAELILVRRGGTGRSMSIIGK